MLSQSKCRLELMNGMDGMEWKHTHTHTQTHTPQPWTLTTNLTPNGKGDKED